MVNSGDWQRRRSQFNHDWLKSKYLNSLQSFIERLSSENLGFTSRLQEFVEIDFPSWEEHSKEAWWIVEHFEQEMSPKNLFNMPPLRNCSEETKEWLIPLAHELWLARGGVRKRVERASDLVRKVDEEFAELSANLPETGDDYHERLKLHMPKWKRFADACLQLSECLSKLPRRIELL